VILGGGYLYLNSEATSAFNAVSESRTVLNYAQGSDGKWYFTYWLKNPSRYDVTYSYLNDRYHGDTFLMKIQFEVSIPSRQTATVEVYAPYE